MKLYKRLWVLLLFIMGICFFISNLFLSQEDTQDRLHLIEVNRLMEKINQGVDYKDISLLELQRIQAIEYRNNEEITQAFLQGEDIKNNHFIIQTHSINHEIVGFFRFLYPIEHSNIRTIINVFLMIIFLGCVALLYYLKITLWKPFDQLNQSAIALSKGNFTIQLHEQQSHGFGKFIWAMNVLRDELLTSKQRELALEKEKKTMIASISHDMRTPIANIALYSQALAKHLYRDEKQQLTCTQRIEENIQKIETYIQSIIDTSTQNLFQVEVVCEDVYIHEVMRRIQDNIVEKMHLLHIHYTSECSVDGLVMIDLEKSMEVIDNVFDNAIKYGDGKEITLYIRKEHKNMFLAISNSGPIPQEGEREYIFQSFYRGSNINDKLGNGLGLYIAKQIMEAMHGDIWLETSVDCTCFVLRFPCS